MSESGGFVLGVPQPQPGTMDICAPAREEAREQGRREVLDVVRAMRARFAEKADTARPRDLVSLGYATQTMRMCDAILRACGETV